MNERLRFSTENTEREKALLARFSSAEISLFDLPISKPSQEVRYAAANENAVRPPGIKLLPDDAPPLPEKSTLKVSASDTARLYGMSVARFSKFLWNELQASAYGLPVAVIGGIASTFLFPPSILAVLASGTAGYASGRWLHKIFVEKDREGFGPHRFGREFYAKLAPGHYPKDSRRENKGAHFILGEKSAKKKQLKKVIDRIAELKTADQMKKITGDPNYKIEEGTGGHCTVHRGKIHIVLNKFKIKFYRNNKPELNTSNYIDLPFGLFRMYIEMGGRSRRACAHELGHAMEFYAFGGTGGLSNYHESHTLLMNDMVRAVLIGKSDSWFHHNTPEPIELPKEPKEIGFKLYDDRMKSRYIKKLAEHEKKIFRQKHWNYSELFAEFTELYLTRPNWVKAHFPEVLQLYMQYISGTPIARHLQLM